MIQICWDCHRHKNNQNTKDFWKMNKTWWKGKLNSKSKHEAQKPRTRTQSVQNINSNETLLWKHEIIKHDYT